jgi:hypothetical protein
MKQLDDNKTIAKWRHDIQLNDVQHNGNQHKGVI